MAATVGIVCAYGGSDGAPTYTSNLIDVGFRFRSDDSPATLDLTNSIRIPTSGFNYSYWVHLCLDISGTFSQINNIKFYCDGMIGWDYGTGGAILVGIRDTGDNGCPVASYDKATGTEGTTGDYMDDDSTEWAASTAYSLGDYVRPTTANGYVYKCTTAGTSGAAEPTWPTTIGQTVTDGSVVWTCDRREGHTYYRGQTATPANITSYTSTAPLVIDTTNYTAASKSKAAVLQTKVDTTANGAVEGVQTAETLTFQWDEI
ncbi:MAG: hypothetical protein U9R01_05215 [candidate division WOR-3 bacterium]|nr:hypothetical protein [candidate division WOR-3 bacterium]